MGIKIGFLRLFGAKIGKGLVIKNKVIQVSQVPNLRNLNNDIKILMICELKSHYY